MANNPEFRYAPMFQLGNDDTEYYKLTSDYVSVGEFEGKPILKIEPEALTMLAQQAFRDVNFLLRRYTTSRWPRSCATPRPATTTSMWP